MHRLARWFLLAVACLVTAPVWAWQMDSPQRAAPRELTIPGGSGQPMSLLMFDPDAVSDSPRAAIVLFHGGGWTAGKAAWSSGTARLMAETGVVAFSVDYRLSDPGGITPQAAVDDAHAAIGWVRCHAAELGIDPDRIAAGGSSAGGHLAAATALFYGSAEDAMSARPDALVLWSPALALSSDPWFVKLVGGQDHAEAMSPARHVQSGVPPTLVLQGAKDTVTPVAGAATFCDRMQEAGNRCDLVVYPDVGHLFTRNLEQQEVPDFQAIDRGIAAAADQKALDFLAEQGFLSD